MKSNDMGNGSICNNIEQKCETYTERENVAKQMIEGTR